MGSSPFHSLPTAGSLFVLIKYLMGRFKRSAGLASVSGGVGCIVSLHGCRFSLSVYISQFSRFVEADGE